MTSVPGSETKKTSLSESDPVVNNDKEDNQPPPPKAATTPAACAIPADATAATSSGSVEMKLRIIRSLQQWTVDQSSDFYYNWLAVITVAILYNVTTIIVRAVLGELQYKYRPVWITLDYVSDTIYVFDMVVRLRTTYLEQGLVIRDGAKLRRHYFRTFQFGLDVASLLPTDLLYLHFGIDFPIVRVNRILHLARVREFFDRTDSRTNYPHIFRIIQLFVLLIICIHWNACIYYQISVWIGLGHDVWVYFGANSTSYPDSSDLLSIYTYSFYWSTLTLAMMGDVPHPVDIPEYCFVVVEFLLALLLFAAIIGNVGDIITSMNTERMQFQEKMDGVKRYMKLRGVNKDIELRVIRWFGYMWNNRQTVDEQEILAALPEKLKAEIAMQVHLETLKRVAIFQECEAGLLVELVLKLKLAVFSPGDYVCRKGDIGRELYIIKRGKLNVVSDDGLTVYATLGEGVVFGEISILNIAGNKNGSKRTANIRSVGYSDLFVLSKEDLWNALAEYPEARKKLLEKGRQVLRKDNLLDEEIAARQELDRLNPEEKLAKLESALTETLDRLASLNESFNGVQRRLKQRITMAEKELKCEQDRLETTTIGHVGKFLNLPGQVVS